MAGSTRVDVSVGRKTGRLCRFLKADGTFTPARSCLRTSYLTARGTTSWTLKLPKLPKGKYIVWSRAFTATRVETKLSSRNFTRLTIK